MRRTASRLAKTVAVVGGVAAVGAAILSPRRGDSYVDARWAKVRRHRYAHRGLFDNEAGVPENSLAAFRRARELGFGVELDVHLTADGRLVVMHDSDCWRMCGRHAVVEETDLSALRELRLLGTDERIPTLAEALRVFEYDAADGGTEPAPVIVEVKTLDDNADELIRLVMGELDRHCVTYCVESFDPRVLVWLRRYRPEVVRGQLSMDFRRGRAVAGPREMAATAMLGNAAARPDFMAYQFKGRDLVAPRLVRALGAKPVYWTIRSPQDLATCEAEGAVGIFEGFVPDSPVSGVGATPPDEG